MFGFKFQPKNKNKMFRIIESLNNLDGLFGPNYVIQMWKYT